MIFGMHVLFLSLVGLFAMYLLLLSVVSLFSRKRSSFLTSSNRRFSIVVPAHNEELSISKTLSSLLAIDYPRNQFEIVVVADNCTDRTAAIARSAGAIVMERTDKNNRGKGFALRWCFDEFVQSSSSYDAVVVIDADSVASQNLLMVLNYELEKGFKVIQISDLVAPQPGYWSAEATRLGFFLYNYVRPLARKVLGWSAGLRGNGMCFAIDVLRSVPWEAYSRAEDLEYGLLLLTRGYRIQFAPEAVVLATMPANSDNAKSQRARWEGGRLPLIRRFAPVLIREAVRQRSLALIDGLIDLVTPALMNILFIAGFMAILSFFLGLVGLEGMYTFAICWSLVITAALLHMVVGVTAGDDPDLIKLILYVPRYAVWKMALYTRLALSKSKREWVRTTREPASSNGMSQEDKD